MEVTHLNLTLGYINMRKATRDGVTIDGSSLTIPEVLVISTNPNTKVKIAEKALEEIALNESYFRKKLESGLVVYGVNTGFGENADTRSENHAAIQNGLIRTLNAGMGRVFPCHYVRSAMVTRLNCLSKAFSGVRPIVPSMLAELVNHNIVPQVPMRGSISASGDLMPLSYIAATMMGRDDLKVLKDGVLVSCPDALENAGLTPLVFGPKEGLAVVNAATFAGGLAATVLYDANIVLLLTQVCTGLSVEALNGKTESFHPVIHGCMPHIGQTEVAENMLTMLEESQLAITTLDMYLPDKHGVLKQDRYSIRSAAQWLGPVVETLKEACRRVTIELNSANDNPTIDHRTDTIAHGGNFQGETLSISLDQTRQVIGVCGKLLFAQFSEIVNAKLNFGLPPNLAGYGTNVDFGFKGCDVAMAAYMSELDHYVNPMSNHVVSAEMHNQSVNSMALVSARLTVEAIEIIQMMIANLLCLTAQALDLRHIRSVVLTEIDVLAKEHPGIHHALKQFEWYDLLFLPEEKASELSTVIADEIEDKLIFQKKVITRMSNLHNRLNNGVLDTSNHLGNGTRKMYTFIRQDLDIPFNWGQAPFDTWLNRILKAIQNRTIEDTLLDVFSH